MRELVEECPLERCQREVVFLGAVSRGRRRVNHDKEHDRLMTAKERMAILCSLKLGPGIFASYARMFALSVACYGWVGRLPPLDVSNKLWAVVKRGQRVAWMANKWLRAVVTGAKNHFDCVTSSSLFRVVFRLARDHGCSWEARPGSPVHELRKWMRKRGWQEHAPWRWTREGLNLQMRGNVNFQRQMHVFRDGWRAWAWGRFVNSDRHELRDLQGVRIQDVLKRDWDRIRRFMQNPACRSFGLGAVVSPAWFGKVVGNASDRCYWCGCLGSWSHIAWFCPHSELLNARPPVPADLLHRRFGWVAKGDRTCVLPHLGQVNNHIWAKRYGDA